MYIGVPPEVDPSFLKQLRSYDRYLDCVFDRALERFLVIWHKPYGPPAQLIVVSTDDGNFRHPDAREISVIAQADFARVSVRDRIIRGEEYMREYAEKEDREITDTFRHQTMDNRLQLTKGYHAAFNLGKFGGAFRRIIHTPKGQVFGRTSGGSR